MTKFLQEFDKKREDITGNWGSQDLSKCDKNKLIYDIVHGSYLFKETVIKVLKVYESFSEDLQVCYFLAFLEELLPVLVSSYSLN